MSINHDTRPWLRRIRDEGGPVREALGFRIVANPSVSDAWMEWRHSGPVTPAQPAQPGARAIPLREGGKAAGGLVAAPGGPIQHYQCGICQSAWTGMAEAIACCGGKEPNPPQHDPINHPRHYTSHPSGVECLTVTRHMGFNLGNAVKYIWRADLKGNAIEDLRKAAFYIADEIKRRETQP